MHDPATTPSSASRTLEDFLTDGSLARMCAEMSSFAGVAIELRDQEDRLVMPAHGTRPWRIDAEAPAVDPAAERVALRIGDDTIGSIVLGASGEELPTGERTRDRVRRTLELLATAAGEICTLVVQSDHRIRELDALYRLTSVLVRAQSLEQVLAAALDGAMETLGLDAGSIVVMPEVAADAADPLTDFATAQEAELRIFASRGLSERWLATPDALSARREFDRLVLEGEVVSVPDLTRDPRVQLKELVEDEGVRGFITVGMTFRGQTLGAIRLYARVPREFSELEIRLLQSIGQQAAVAVEQARLLETQRRERKIRRALRFASDVQHRMLPVEMPQAEGIDLAARYVPSLELGGDFYDVFEAGEGTIGLTVGDVVGKGVAAALLMAATRASLRAIVEQCDDPAEVIGRVNGALCRDTLESEFATLWYGVADPASGRLTFCSAGHEPPMLVRVPDHRPPTRADLDELAIGGLVAGIDPSQRYQSIAVDLQPGDTLVAYTDGMTDARDFHGERFGKDRLMRAVLDILREQPDAPARHLVDQLTWTLRRFTGLARRVDDQTLLVLRYKV
ncbi:MAG: GAF domain-containing SpoIIE family protein phosphatase [Planctomycetota bacterium]